MKDKVLVFIIGFLVGAIVATGGFIIYNKVKKPNNMRNEFFEENMDKMKMKPGEFGEFNEGNMPPEKPEDKDFNKKQSEETNTDQKSTEENKNTSNL